MKNGNWIWAALLGLLVAPALAANKCIDASGRISYQATPCPKNTRGGDMSLNINRPFTGQAKSPVTEGAAAVTTESEDSSLNNGQDRNAQPGKDSER